MNILIKLTCLVGLVIAPILGDGHSAEAHQGHEEQKEISVEVTNTTEGETIATITKEGKSICFTDAVLYQNEVLIATSSATNKLVDNPF